MWTYQGSRVHLNHRLLKHNHSKYIPPIIRFIELCFIKQIDLKSNPNEELAFMYVVEYQKRGLPHAHILVIISDDDRLRTPEDVDQVICAEIPHVPENLTDEAKNQCRKLRDIVLKCMIHGPCGNRNQRSPCMINGKCSKTVSNVYKLEQAFQLPIIQATRSWFRRRNCYRGWLFNWQSVCSSV